MKTKFRLTIEDRRYLKRFTKTGKRNSKEIKHGYILLAIDKGKAQVEIMDYYDVGRSTIWRIKNKYSKNGLESALWNAPRSGQPLKYKEQEEARIAALAFKRPPKGKPRWTLKLMAEMLKKQNKMKTINRETIRLVLKKSNITLKYK